LVAVMPQGSGLSMEVKSLHPLEEEAWAFHSFPGALAFHPFPEALAFRPFPEALLPVMAVQALSLDSV
jgi:hypothetical protein